MLAKVLRPDGKTVEFGYDALGRRVWKKYQGKTTKWVWDGNVPVHEWVEVEGGVAEPADERVTESEDAGLRQRAVDLAKRSAQGPPHSGPLAAGSGPLAPRSGARVRGAGTATHPITWVFEPESFAPAAKLVGDQHHAIITDHLGTPTAMLDAAGQVAWSADIGIYGDLRHVVGEKQACPFRWPGQYEDEETGLYYNRFRYYDPQSGEYVSQDPIGLRGGLQLLAYPRDPSSHIDPLGLAPCVARDPKVAAAIASGRPIIVLGRTQATRVDVIGAQIKAAGGNVHLHHPKRFWGATTGNLERRDMENNRVWLRYWAKEKGALVVDIGPDPRRGLTNLGEFYGMERRSVYQHWKDDGIDIVQFDPGF